MGYELNKLMQQFGVSTPGVVAYSGPAAPMVPVEPVYDPSAGEGIFGRIADRAKYELAKQDYDKQLADFPDMMRRYGLAQKEYDAYKNQFKQRVGATPMYTDMQYQTGMPGSPTSPNWSSPVLNPTFGQVPASLAGKSLEEQQAYYRRLRDLGYTDADIRANATKTFGPIVTDEGWRTLTNTTAPSTSPPPAYTTLSLTSTPDEIARAYDQYIGPPTADTFANRMFITDYLKNKGFTQDALNTAYSTYLQNQKTPLYESLSLQHSPADVARAYAHFVAQSGGDTEANRNTAITYLKNLGFTDENIGSAYDFYKKGTYSHGGSVHSLAQKYKVGGQVRRYRLGGDEGEPIVGEEELPMMLTGATETAPVTASPAAQPVMPPTSAPTPISPAAADLNALMNRYLSAESAYGPELTAARRRLDTESKAFESLIANAIKGDTAAPDKTEMYFRLAAAFGSPSKTGRFTENLAMAGKEMGEYAKDVRAAKKAERQLGLQLGLEAQKLKMQGARDELSTLRTLAGEEMKDKRAVLQEYIKSGRPQSEAGKAAVDAGLVQGTPEFTAFVEKYIDDKIRSGNMLKEAMVAIAGSRESRAAESAKKLTPKEVELKSNAETAIGSLNDAMESLKRAYALNPNTFEGTWASIAQQKILEQTDPKDPRVLATREQRNLLGKGAIERLKASFGGNPTEGERAALLELEGLDAKSKEERARIMLNTYNLLKARKTREEKRLKDITSGLYRETTPSTGDIE